MFVILLIQDVIVIPETCLQLFFVVFLQNSCHLLFEKKLYHSDCFYFIFFYYHFPFICDIFRFSSTHLWLWYKIEHTNFKSDCFCSLSSKRFFFCKRDAYKINVIVKIVHLKIFSRNDSDNCIREKNEKKRLSGVQTCKAIIINFKLQ